MLMPSIFEDNMFDDWMDFSFPEFGRPARRESTQNIMRTDVKETGQGYEVDIELPGFKKEDVKAELKDGYLTIRAARNIDNSKKDSDGKYIRRERCSGSMSRQFYVGKDVKQEDIRARFEDGVLKLSIPKKDAQQAEQSKYIAIEG